MDKYTVDLDKVLNDFEYSELTEHTENQQPQPVQQPHPDTLGRNGAVKHSINNVFSSLNEYLNTEITPYELPLPREDHGIKQTDCYGTEQRDFLQGDHVNPEEHRVTGNEAFPKGPADFVKCCYYLKNIDGCAEKQNNYVKGCADYSEEQSNAEFPRVGQQECYDNKLKYEYFENKLQDDASRGLATKQLSKNEKHAITNEKQMNRTDKGPASPDPQIESDVPERLECQRSSPFQVFKAGEQYIPDKDNTSKPIESTGDAICDNDAKAVGFDSALEIDDDELNKYLDDLEQELEREGNALRDDENLEDGDVYNGTVVMNTGEVGTTEENLQDYRNYEGKNTECQAEIMDSDNITVPQRSPNVSAGSADFNNFTHNHKQSATFDMANENFKKSNLPSSSTSDNHAMKYYDQSSDKFNKFANDSNTLETINSFTSSNDSGDVLCTYAANGNQISLAENDCVQNDENAKREGDQTEPKYAVNNNETLEPERNSNVNNQSKDDDKNWGKSDEIRDKSNEIGDKFEKVCDKTDKICAESDGTCPSGEKVSQCGEMKTEIVIDSGQLDDESCESLRQNLNRDEVIENHSNRITDNLSRQFSDDFDTFIVDDSKKPATTTSMPEEFVDATNPRSVINNNFTNAKVLENDQIVNNVHSKFSTATVSQSSDDDCERKLDQFITSDFTKKSSYKRNAKSSDCMNRNPADDVPTNVGEQELDDSKIMIDGEAVDISETLTAQQKSRLDADSLNDYQLIRYKMYLQTHNVHYSIQSTGTETGIKKNPPDPVDFTDFVALDHSQGDLYKLIQSLVMKRDEVSCDSVETNNQTTDAGSISQPSMGFVESQQTALQTPRSSPESPGNVDGRKTKSEEDAGSINSEMEAYESCSENVSERCASKNEVSDMSLNQSERPNSLDIAANGDGKREINLIGNPGSTPYNNLYVSKEIPADKPKPVAHYESESSASVSPTFSEASTDSVRSTDSTDSEGELAKDVPEDVTVGSSKDSTTEAKSDIPEETGSVASGSGMGDTTSEDTVKAEAPSEGTSDVGNVSEIPESEIWLGKRAPVWIPDSDALNCLHCDMKFTVIKRRHHCRACGLVLCSKCCNLKYRLEYLDMEARVCTRCHDILSRDSNSSSGSEVSPAVGNSPNRQPGQPNPNNPMEYCSVVPPLQQVSGSGDNPPSVMVPVGVLKRKGSNKAKHNKSVMFCDGIRPGSDLTNLDNDFNYNETRSTSSRSTKKSHVIPKVNRNVPTVDSGTKSFIPENENCLPPTVTTFKSDTTYTECANNASVVEMLKNETLIFALQRNLHVHVRLITMECCINKQTWCFSTEGLINVGQDEIIILLEYIDNERVVPKDIFYHLNNIYNDAVKGNTVTELGLSMHPTTNFLDSKNHAGFIYIRPTFQCLKNVIVPKEPYLIGILVHRWETPWAKIFPLRLVLRLGAEYRYYPSPVISTRHRDSVFVEIGHTIINLLADFRNFSYTLPNIRGLTIHMEGKNTTVTIPANRYDQVMKSISNSSDHILAFGGNFSMGTDSHLVCIQDVHGNNENNYTTHAINIQNKPRKVTGASFIVFNGALKSTSGLTAKSSIVEDGLMIQIPAEQMVQVRESLRNMKNHTIQCGCVNATSDETVNVIWGEPDVNFNVGVKSSVDEQPLSGVPSIRVHNGKDYVCNSGNRLIRWTEVFLLQNGEENARTQDPVDISKVAESISKATCQALVKYLDLLATNNFYKIGIRTTLHVENVSYSAGSNGIKLPPIYMKSLDNELIPVLHRITSNNFGDNVIVLELIFRILNV